MNSVFISEAKREKDSPLGRIGPAYYHQKNKKEIPINVNYGDKGKWI